MIYPLNQTKIYVCPPAFQLIARCFHLTGIVGTNRQASVITARVTGVTDWSDSRTCRSSNRSRRSKKSRRSLMSSVSRMSKNER